TGVRSARVQSGDVRAARVVGAETVDDRRLTRLGAGVRPGCEETELPACGGQRRRARPRVDVGDESAIDDDVKRAGVAAALRPDGRAVRAEEIDRIRDDLLLARLERHVD